MTLGGGYGRRTATIAEHLTARYAALVPQARTTAIDDLLREKNRGPVLVYAIACWNLSDTAGHGRDPQPDSGCDDHNLPPQRCRGVRLQ